MEHELDFIKMNIESEDGTIRTSAEISKTLADGVCEFINKSEKEDGVDAIGLNEILAVGYVALVSGDNNGN